MKNILVTGGCGFIGSNFVRYLLSQKDFTGRIINLDKLTYAGNIANLAGLEKEYPDRYLFIRGNICDKKLIDFLFQEYHIDTICHFAAESHVDRSISNPFHFVETNLIGTFTLLEVARNNMKQFELFHHISTDEVFGSLGETGQFTEDTAYHPNNPYSATKAGSDHLVRSYSNTYQLPVTVSNCSNNYGPYQFPEKLIPLTIMNALERKEIPVYGDGKNMRDWLYVEDHCSAIWAIMKDGKRGETYNVGGNNDIRNIDIVGTICDLLEELQPETRNARDLIKFVTDRPGHDWRYAIDSSKLQNGLDWSPSESFETGIRRTIEWYLAHQQWVEEIRTGDYLLWIKKHYGNEKVRQRVPVGRVGAKSRSLTDSY